MLLAARPRPPPLGYAVSMSSLAAFKIILLTPRFPPDPGGVAQASARQARCLQAEGRLAAVLIPNSSEPTAPAQVEPSLKAQENLIIHAYYPSLTAPLALDLAQSLQAPIIFSARGNDLDRDIWKREVRQYLLPALQEAAALTGVTRELQRKLQALCPHTRSVYVPNSVATDFYRPRAEKSSLRLRYGLPEKGLVMGFVGEARLKKGWPILLQAFALLAQAFPDLHLLVVGLVRPGLATDTLRVWQKQHPELQARLQVWSYQEAETLRDLYACLDLLVLPSYQEGMANAALEAMASGIPVLATQTGGFPDLIQEGLEGALVPPYQVEALVTKAAELLQDAALRRSMGQAAREKVLREFTPEREWHAWRSLYTDVMGGRS